MIIDGQVMGTGAIASPVDLRDYRLSSVLSKDELPVSFELPMCDVKNQWSISSCVAHALSSIIEYHYKKENNAYVKFSTGYIYGNRTDYVGQGMILRDALKTVASNGDVRNSLFDYNIEVPKAINKFNELNNENLIKNALPYRFSSYYKCTTQEEIKTALMKHGPVLFSIKWYNDIKVDPITGIIKTSCNKNDTDGSHCMVIYGWNESGWKIQNSWGAVWGIDGRAILPYNVPLNEAWGISDTIREKDAGADNDVVKPFNSNIGKIFAKTLNIIVRGAKIIYSTAKGVFEK